MIQTDAAWQLMSDLTKLEAELFAKPRDHVLRKVNEAGEREDARLGTAGTNLATTRDELARRAHRSQPDRVRDEIFV